MKKIIIFLILVNLIAIICSQKFKKLESGIPETVIINKKDEFAYFKVDQTNSFSNSFFVETFINSCRGQVEIYTKHCHKTREYPCPEDDVTNVPSESNFNFFAKDSQRSQLPFEKTMCSNKRCNGQHTVFFIGVKALVDLTEFKIEMNAFEAGAMPSTMYTMEKRLLESDGVIRWEPLRKCIRFQGDNCVEDKEVQNVVYKLYYAPYDKDDPYQNMGTICGITKNGKAISEWISENSIKHEVQGTNLFNIIAKTPDGDEISYQTITIMSENRSESGISIGGIVGIILAIAFIVVIFGGIIIAFALSRDLRSAVGAVFRGKKNYQQIY